MLVSHIKGPIVLGNWRNRLAIENDLPRTDIVTIAHTIIKSTLGKIGVWNKADLFIIQVDSTAFGIKHLDNI